MFYFLILFTIVFNVLLFLNLKSISHYMNVYDYPDKVRKFHTKKVPLLGGFIIYLNIFILFTSAKFIDYDYPIFLNTSSFLLISLFFFIGIYDDKKNISPILKLTLLSLGLIIFFYESKLLISTLNFKLYFRSVDLEFSSIFFSTLCVLLFLNSLNMFDGVNNQVIFYSIFFIIILLFYKFNIYYLLLIIPLFFVSYFNFLNKIFLGYSGVYIIALIISLNIFEIYIYQPKSIYPEEIFLLMFIPGLDMFRLFIHRIILRRNPFSADRLHLHHLLLNKLNVKLIPFFTILVTFFFWSIFVFFPIFYILIISIFFYSLVFYWAIK